MYEDKVKKLLASDIFRGKTDVYITFESYSKADVQVRVNHALAESYVEALNEINTDFKLDDKIGLSLVARFPDLITVEKNSVSEDEQDHIWQCLEQAAGQALANFVAMRSTEGEALKVNILDKLNGIESAIKRVEARAPQVAVDYRQRLKERLAEIEELKNIDESRLIAEVALFADKACIDEEITRMFSHISQMRTILGESVPVGRKLDFLVQEMNREVNTMGSKSNDLEITGIIVDTKSEIEKIREQIQNLE
jgi:uncharacterized protein (TIGR00255 family)